MPYKLPIRLFLAFSVFFCLISCHSRIYGPPPPTIAESLQYGESLYHNQEYRKAKSVFLNLVKRSPDNADAHYWLGTIHTRQAAFAKGVEAFQKVVAIDPTYAKAFYNLGAIYATVDSMYSVEKASHYFNRYLALDDNPPYKEKIVNWLDKNDALSEQAPAGENQQAAIFEKVDGLIEKKAFKKAGRILKDYLKSHPDSGVAHYKLGIVRINQDLLVDGRNELLKAILKKPDFSKAYYNLGVIYSKPGETYNPTKAAFFFRKHLSLEPESPHKNKILDFLNDDASPES
ncbi:MAG: tetratricopeptide repeat protein [Desulfobacterales bacterium]|nr:tetratricopeptide repeat protein [Desulfobacterales bacterium]